MATATKRQWKPPKDEKPAPPVAKMAPVGEKPLSRQNSKAGEGEAAGRRSVRGRAEILWNGRCVFGIRFAQNLDFHSGVFPQ